MLKGFNENGEVKNVKVTDAGAIKVAMEDSGSSKAQEVIVKTNETTLYAGILTVGTTEQTIGVSKKITQISIANYSETANVTVAVDETNYTIAPNLAVDLPINKSVGIVGLSATEADTKVQYVIKGEE